MASKYIPPHQRSMGQSSPQQHSQQQQQSQQSQQHQQSFSGGMNPNAQSYSSNQLSYNKSPPQSYQSNGYGNNNNSNTTNSYQFADSDTTNYDLGFASSSSTNTNNDRFRRFGGNSRGGGSRGRGRGRGGRGRGRGRGGGSYGGGRYGGGGNGRGRGGGNRFSRPRGGGGGGGGYNNGGYSTYTDRYSSNAASTERNLELEKELFGSSDTVQQGINFENFDKIPVEVSGRDAPEAVLDFTKSNLNDILLSNISLCKYTSPTPIQKYSIPCVLNNRDVMACAQTGSGKTAAFLLPIIHNLMSDTAMNKNGYYQRSNGYNNREVYPSAVVLSPTRELAIQIHVEARKFLYRTGLRTCVVYGGADWRKQARDLRYGVDIIVATPGRLNDFMERGFVKMSNVRYNVLDEADRMLDMGFMPQIKQIIHEMPPKRNVNDSMNNNNNTNNVYRQTLMFSATFPLEIQKLAQDFLSDYIFIAVGRVGSTNAFIEQQLKYVDEYDKTTKLIEIVNTMTKTDDGRIPLTLIFVEKKKDAARVEKELIRSGYDAMSIHGDRSQREREHALKMFRSGKVSLLVATDVASRGLDIPNVMYVINYDLPSHIDAYVHRIGRTGRCGNNGNAISFVNETNKPIIKSLMTLLKESKSEIPQWFADLYYKYSSYSFSGYGRNKGGYNKRGYGGGSSYGGKFGARDFRHNNKRGGGSGYKRNTYNHYNHNKHNNNNNNNMMSNMNSNHNNNSSNNQGYGGYNNMNSNNTNNNATSSWSSNAHNNISDSW